ncbi:MAG: hypothetical protein AABO58_09660 [Acidobacteriota bacterium]
MAQEDFRAAAEAYNAKLQQGNVPPETAVGQSLPGHEEAPSGVDVSTLISASSSDEAEDIGRGDAVTNHTGPPRAAARRYATLFWSVLLVGIGTLLWWIGRSRPATPPVIASPPVTFEIPPALGGVYDTAFGGDVSPDGTQIVFLARSIPSMRRMLFVHSVSDRSTRPLPASEGNYTSFFWNSDSRSIFFVSKVDLMKISITGDAPERVGYAGEAVKGTVNGDGVVVLGSRKGLLRVKGTGEPEVLTRLQPGEVAHSLPSFLPDGDQLLFTITRKTLDQTVTRVLAVLSLRTRAMRTLFAIPSRVQYANGQLLYVRGHTLFARPFDLRELRFSGPERAVAAPVWANTLTGETGFSASSSTLLVTPPLGIPPVYHMTPHGRIRTIISEPEGILYVAVGRATNQLAVVGRGVEGDELSLWLYPLDGRERVRLVTEYGEPSSPLFSPDDRLVYYADAGTSWANIYAIELRPGVKNPRAVLLSKDVVAPRDVSPDGRFLLFQRWQNRDGNLWYAPVDDPQHSKPLVATQEDEGESARFSSDGRHVAFVAKRGTEYSVYVADFPPSGQLAKQAIHGDGWRVRWSSDGRRIYFARGASVMEADPSTRQTRRLFDMHREIALLELASDGGFFVREAAIERNRTVATLWWPRLIDRPLDLSALSEPSGN